MALDQLDEAIEVGRLFEAQRCTEASRLVDRMLAEGLGRRDSIATLEKLCALGGESREKIAAELVRKLETQPVRPGVTPVATRPYSRVERTKLSGECRSRAEQLASLDLCKPTAGGFNP
jgi:hypothetical protein